MIVNAIKTPIINPYDDLLGIIAESIPGIEERSVLVITSKVVSYWQGDLVKKELSIVDEDEKKRIKHDLAKKEAEWYLDPNNSKYNLIFTIKNQTLAVNAGIDESNADGYYLLWPKNPQQAINKIWNFVREHYGLKEVGVTFSDSKTYPLRWGVTGTCIASCGFNPLRDYVGTKDLFGYEMKMEQTNLAEGLTIAAVMEMGEGAEQKPLAVIEDISDIEFVDHVPNEEELEKLKIDIEDDFFEPVLKSVEWKRGGSI